MKEVPLSLRKLREEYDFINRKIGELQWERAVIVGEKGEKCIEYNRIDEMIKNYIENMLIILDKVEDETYYENSKK